MRGLRLFAPECRSRSTSSPSACSRRGRSGSRRLPSMVKKLYRKGATLSAVEGLVIADRYEVLGLIAEGGQGLVARARDRQTGHLVAVKMLTSAAAQNPEFVKRLAR